jgi:hypothetical protein
MSPLILYGHPVVHVICGALGGWLGYLVWKPVSEPAQTESKVIAGKAKLARRRAALFGGRVAWFRVTIGVAIALAGCLSATYVRNAILDVTTGRLATTDFQDYVITWELKALAVLLGGVAAGINTRNGPKQGLCVGLAVAALLVGYETHGVTRFVEVSGLLAGGSVALCLAGGWFGSTLFPPVVKVQRIPIGAGV